MKSATPFLTIRRLTILAACAALAACGGGSGQSSGNTTAVAGLVTVDAANFLTDVRIENTSAATAQANVPVTFGQVFTQGSVSKTDVLVGRLEDGTTVPLQVDVKATHADGSVRHAVISAIIPTLAAGSTRTLSLNKGGTAGTATTASVSGLMRTGFSFSMHATINGVDYYASADDLLKTSKANLWLQGPVANEWQVSAPLRAVDGTVHPHLSARFAVRWYDSIKQARVDMTVENDWAYEPAPQNFTYDANVVMAGKSVYAKSAMTHNHHARWRKLFWWNGTQPQVNVRHNTKYLIATGALPNYDQSLVIPETVLAGWQNRWTTSNTEPMGTGLANPYMPSTGGRDEIGLLPGWSATYLLSQDARMKEMTLRNADLAGSFSAHYRDRNTGRPISLADYPYMTVLGNYGDTYNPVTKKYEAFPSCATGMCNTNTVHDTSHQAAFAYLPYLVTGDYFYLEELQFWAMWDAFSSNPGYRQNIKGLLQDDQVRGQGWSLRTLAEASYISPDNDALKPVFTAVVNNNLDWYNATYTNNASANQLNAILNGYAIGYDNGTGMAPWQDDFFTSAVGHAAEMGFDKANALLAWKVKFPISRMVGAGACWIDGAIYNLKVRDTSTSPFYTSIGAAYQASHTSTFNALECGSAAMASALGLQVGEMTGYSSSTLGYPSNMQPALAYAANIGGADGKSAWAQFMARSVKPDYRTAPQFAIVPR